MLKKLAMLSAVPMVLLAFVQPAEARRFLWWDFPDDPSYDQRHANYDDLTPQERFNLRQYELYRREMYHRYGRSAYQEPGPDYGYVNPNVPYADPVTPLAKKPVKRKVVTVKPVVKPVAKPDVANTVASTATSAATVDTTAAAKVDTTAAAATIDTPAAPKANTTAVAAIDSTAIARPTDTTAVASTTPVTIPPAPDAAAVSAATPAAMQAQATTATKKAKPATAVTCDKGQGIVSSFGFSNVVSKTCTGKSLVYSAERGGSKFEVEVSVASGELTAVRKL